MIEEAEQVLGRVVEGDRGRTRPHARHHRDHEVLHEIRREAPGGEEPAQAHRISVGPRPDRRVRVTRRQDGPGPSVEALHLEEHAHEGRARRPAWLREQPTEAPRAGVLEPAAEAPHRHAHLARTCLDPELVEQPHEVRIGAFVVDDEPAVDGHRAGRAQHVVRVRVSTEAMLGFVERHIRRALEEVGRGEARHTRAHHCHPRSHRGHGRSSSRDTTRMHAPREVPVQRLLRCPASGEAEPPSSSGPGRRPFKAVTGIRTPLGARRSLRRSQHLVLWCSLECTPPCQGGGRGFKSRQDRWETRLPHVRGPRLLPRPGSSVGRARA